MAFAMRLTLVLAMLVAGAAQIADAEAAMKAEKKLARIEEKLHFARLKAKAADDKAAEADSVVRQNVARIRHLRSKAKKAAICLKHRGALAKSRMKHSAKLVALAAAKANRARMALKKAQFQVNVTGAALSRSSNASILADKTATLARADASRNLRREQKKLRKVRTALKSAAFSAKNAAKKADTSAELALYTARQATKDCADKDYELGTKASKESRLRAENDGASAARAAASVKRLSDELAVQREHVAKAKKLFDDVPSPAKAAAARIDSQNYFSLAKETLNAAEATMSEARDLEKDAQHRAKEVTKGEASKLKLAKDRVQNVNKTINVALDRLTQLQRAAKEDHEIAKKRTQKSRDLWRRYKEQRTMIAKYEETQAKTRAKIIEAKNDEASAAASLARKHIALEKDPYVPPRKAPAAPKKAAPKAAAPAK